MMRSTTRNEQIAGLMDTVAAELAGMQFDYVFLGICWNLQDGVTLKVARSIGPLPRKERMRCTEEVGASHRALLPVNRKRLPTTWICFFWLKRKAACFFQFVQPQMPHSYETPGKILERHHPLLAIQPIQQSEIGIIRVEYHESTYLFPVDVA